MMKQFLSGAVSVFAVALAFTAGVGAVIPNIAAPAAERQIVLAPEKLEAKAALLYDPADGRVLYQKNGNDALPLASLTKLMTAHTVLAAFPDSAYVAVTRDDLRPEGDVGLRPGERFTLGELVDLALVASSNDAITAAAAAALGDPMVALNKEAEALALTKTYFLNPTGLDVSKTSAGARGSAYDMARLAAAFYKKYPAYFEQTSRGEVRIAAAGHTIAEDATALPLQDIPGFVGAKTGYTDLAGGNVVAIFDLSLGRPVVAVILGSSYDGRFSDMRKLIGAVRVCSTCCAGGVC